MDRIFFETRKSIFLSTPRPLAQGLWEQGNSAQRFQQKIKIINMADSLTRLIQEKSYKSVYIAGICGQRNQEKGKLLYKSVYNPQETRYGILSLRVTLKSS